MRSARVIAAATAPCALAMALLLLLAFAAPLALLPVRAQHNLANLSFAHTDSLLAAWQPGPLFLQSSATGEYAGTFDPLVVRDYSLSVPFATRNILLNLTQTNGTEPLGVNISMYTPLDSATPAVLLLDYDEAAPTDAVLLGPLARNLSGVHHLLQITSAADTWLFHIMTNAPDTQLVVVQPYPQSYIVARVTFNETDGTNVTVPSPLPQSVRPTALSRIFSADKFNYTIVTDYVCTSVNVTVTLTTLSSAVVYEIINGTVGESRNLSLYATGPTSAVVSFPVLYVAPTSHQFVVSSVLDGNYTYTVRRLAPDLIDADLFVTDTHDLHPDAAPVLGPVLPYLPGVLNSPDYVLTVPHRFVRAQLSLFFYTNRSLFLNFETNGTTVANYTTPPQEELLHGGTVGPVRSRLYDLATGLNTFRFNSLKDGNGSVVVVRRAPDVTRIALLAVNTLQSGVVTTTPLAVEPMATSVFYNPREYNQSFTVGRIVSRVNLTLAYGVAHSVQVDLGAQVFGPSIEALADPFQPDVLNNTEHSFELAIGVNILRINSTQDGTYTLRITRLSTDLVALSLRGGVPSETELTPDLMASALPPLVPGVTSNGSMSVAHVVHVDWRVWSVQLTAEFVTPSTLFFDGQALQSLNASAPVALAQGQNNLTIHSEVDGTYLLHIIRAAPSVTALAWSPPNSTVTNPPSVPGALRWLASPLEYNASLYNYTAVTSYNPSIFSPAIAATPGDNITLVHSFFWPTGVNGTLEEFFTTTVLSLNSNGTVLAHALDLEVGLNILTIRSARDGSYVLRLERLKPDVLDIVLRGSTAQNASAQAWPSEAFSPETNSYTLALQYKYFSLAVAVEFATAGSVNVSAAVVPALDPNVTATTFYPASNRTYSPEFALPIYPYSLVVRVDSAVDGTYLLNATRAQPNLVGVALTPSVGEVAHKVVPSPIPYSAAFAPGLYNYSATVDFLQATLNLLVREDSGAADNLTIEWWSVPTQLVSVNVSTTNTTTNETTTVLVEMMPEPVVHRWVGASSVPVLSLAVGQNVLRILSENDGVYTFTITRRPADMILAQVVAYYPASPLRAWVPDMHFPPDAADWIPAVGTLVPAFRPGTLEYNCTLPYKMRLASSYASWRSDAQRVVFDFNSRDVLALPELNATVSPTWFPLGAFPVQNQMWLTTSMDGIYHFNVVVSPPDMRALEVEAFVDGLGQLSRGSVRLTPVSVAQYPQAASTTPAPGTASGFQGGSMLYVAQVATSVAFLNVRASWLDSEADVRVVCNGAELRMHNGSWLLNSTMAAAAASFNASSHNASEPLPPFANYSAAMIPLLPGVTNLCELRSSNDGLYLFAVARGNITLDVIDVPRYVYANRTSRAIGVQLRGGYTGWPSPLALQVNLSSTLGSVSPGLLDFSGASGLGADPLRPSVLLTRTFFLTVPVVPVPTIVSLLFGVRGADAWQIDPFVPATASLLVEPINTTIVGGFSLRAETVPASVLINSVSTRLMLTHTVSGRPDGNNTVTLSLRPSVGVVRPSSLTFTAANWDEALSPSGSIAHSFLFDAPDRVANVSFSWSISGVNDNNNNNPEQYVLPPAFFVAVKGFFSLVINDGQAGAVGATVPSPNIHYLYANQVSEGMSLQPRGMDTPSVAVVLSSPNGGGGNQLVLTPSELVWNGWHNSASDPLGQSYPGETSVAQSFTLQSQTGPALGQSYFVELELSLAGVSLPATGVVHDNSSQFEPIPPQLFIILPQASLSLGSNFPASLFAGELSAQLSITASALPNGGVGDLRVVISALDSNGTAVGTVSPPFVTLTSSSALGPLYFSYRAPSRAQTVVFSFKVAGTDAPHYGAIAPRILAVLPLAMVGLTSAPLSLYAGSSGVALTFTSNLLPPTGVVVTAAVATLDAAGNVVSDQALVGTISRTSFVVAPPAVSNAASVGAVLRQSFTVTAPAQAGSLVISFSVSGTDRLLFNSLIPTTTIAVLASSAFVVRGMPTLMFERGSALISVGPLRRPLDTLTLTPTTVPPNVGSFTPPGGLTFLNGEWSAQNVTFFAPDFVSTLQIVWVVGGNSGGAFSAPSPTTINILAPIVLRNVPVAPSGALYLKQQSAPLPLSFTNPSPDSANHAVYPFTVAFSCSFGDCIVTPSQIVVTSLAAAEGSSIVVTAPSSLPPGGSIELSVSILGVAANRFFTMPTSVFVIPILPRGTFAVSGSLDVYSYGSTTVTIVPTVAPTVGTTVTLTLPSNTAMGTLNKYSMPFSANALAPQSFIYTAPTNLPLAAQKLPIVLTATINGVASPQFVMPTVELNLRGPRVFSACAAGTSVMVRGLPGDKTSWVGVYVPIAPLNDFPRYTRAVSDAVGADVISLYYHQSNGWTLGKLDVFDVDTFLYGPDATATAEPFGSAWERRLNDIGGRAPVATLAVECTPDCSVIGTPASIETRVCFGNQPLLGVPGPSLPLQSCPLSCARYLPTLVSQCQRTPFYQHASVRPALDALHSTCTASAACGYEKIVAMLSPCGMSLSGNDLVLDLLDTIVLPADVCPSGCPGLYNDFYANCVSKQAVVPERFKIFATKCSYGSGQLPAPVRSVTVAGVETNSVTLGWAVSEVAAWSQTIVITYEVSVCHNCTALQAASASFTVYASGITLNSVRVAGLLPDTPYAFRVLARNGAGDAAPSPVVVQWTRRVAPDAPTLLLHDAPERVAALGPALSDTFNVRFAWNRSASALAAPAGDILYRLVLTPSTSALDASPHWDARASTVACTTAAEECLATGLQAGTHYRAELTARSVGDNTLWSTNSTTDVFFTDPLAPLAPTLLPPQDYASAVTNHSVTLSWVHVASCGAANCSTASYELQALSLGLTYGTAATGSWTSVASIPFPAATPSSSPLLLSATFFGAQAGTDYTFRLHAHNSARTATSAELRVSTPGLRPSVLHLPVLSAMGGGVLQAYWNSSGYFFDDGRTPIDAYRFVLTPVTAAGAVPGAAVEFRRPADQLVIQSFTDGSSGFVLSMTGLQTNQPFTVRMEVRTSGGPAGQWSGLENSPLETLTLPPPPPRFLSFLARGATASSGAAFAPGCTMDLRFDAATNTSTSELFLAQSEVDRLLSFSAAIPAAYTGAWNADRTVLTITIGALTPGAAAASFPVVGLFSARVVGALRNSDASSTSLGEEPVSLSAQVLLGSWAGGVALAPASAAHLLPFASTPSVVQEGLLYPLGIQANNASLLLNNSALTLRIRCTNCLLTHPVFSFASASAAAVAAATPAGLVRASELTLTTSYGALASKNPWFNPLLQISYTPNPLFHGLDVVVATLEGSGSGLGSETFNYPIRVSQLNHAPVITVPAVASAYNAWETQGVALAGLAVRDQDSQSNTPVRVVLSSTSSVSATFTLVAALPAQGASANLRAVGQSGPSFDFTCQQSLVAQVLSAVRFRDAGLDVDDSAPIRIDVHADDLGSGISGAVARTADAIYSFQPTCIGAPAPVLQQIRLSDDLAAVEVVFDGAVKMAFPAGITPSSRPLSTTSCALFVDTPTLAALGVGSTCFQSAPSVVSLRMGSGASLRVGSTVTLNPASSLVRRCTGATLFASGSAVLAAPLAPAVPVVVIQAPSTVGACQDLVLNALALNVSVAASGARFDWQAESIDAGGVASPAPTLLGLTVPTGASVTVPAALLVADTRYRFTVVLTTSLGVRSLPRCAEVVKASRALPSATPLTPLLVHTSTLVPVTLVAQATLPSECVSAWRPDQQQIKYAWTSSDAALLLPASASTRSLYLAARSLQPDTVYTFTLTASLVEDVSASSSLTFTVRTQPAAVAVVPTRTSMAVPLGAAFQVPLVQPVPNVFDPTAAAAAQPVISWSCTRLQDESASVPCVHALTNLPLGEQTTTGVAPLPVAAGSFLSGRYTFTAHVDFSSTMVPLSVVVVTVASTSRFPSVQIVASAQLLDGDSALVLRSQLYGSDGVLLSESALRSASYAYEWSVSGPFAPSFADASITTGASSPLLSINAAGRAVLPPGAALSFRLRVTDQSSGESGVAETTVRVRAAPVAGSFIVEPASGTAGVTLFRVSAVGWTSGSGSDGASSLRYDYALINWLDGRALPFGASSGSATDADMMLHAGNAASAAGYGVTLRLTVTDTATGARTVVTAPVLVYPSLAQQGPSASAVSARESVRAAQTLTLSNAQNAPQLLSLLNAHASLAAYQSANLTAGALLLPGTFPRCNANSVPLLSSSQLVPVAIVSDSNTFTYANSGSSSGGAAVIAAATLAASNAAALSTARALVEEARPFLSAGTSGTFSAELVSPVLDTSAPVLSLRLCINLANNAAVAVSPDLIGSTTQASSLVSMCATTLENALRTSDLVCSAATSPSCAANQAAVLSDIVTAAVSLMHLQAGSTATTVAEDAVARTVFLGLVSQSLDRMSLQGALHSAGQAISVQDCDVQVAVMRTLGSQAASYTLGSGSGSGGAVTVTYPPLWLASAQGSVTLTAAALNDTAIDSRFVYELESAPTALVEVVRLGGVLSASRSLIRSAALFTAIAASDATVVVRMPYDAAACNATVCSPQCTLWDTVRSRWQGASTSEGGIVSTRITATAGVVECVVSRTPTLMLTVIAGPPVVVQPSSSSTGAGGGGSGGGSLSSTGTSGPSNSSTGGVEPLCPTCYGPLGGPAPSSSSLPDPAAQLWAVNATLVLSLPASMISAALGAGLQLDLATAAAIEPGRVLLYRMSPGSIVASFYIYPSLSGAGPTPDVAFAQLVAASADPASALSTGGVTRFGLNLTMANYFPSTHCADGSYALVCPLSSSTGGGGNYSSSSSSSTGSVDTLGGGGGSSSSFFVEGTNLIIFIVVLALGIPLLFLLLFLVVWAWRRHQLQAKKDEEMLEGAKANLAKQPPPQPQEPVAPVAAAAPAGPVRVPLPAVVPKSRAGFPSPGAAAPAAAASGPATNPAAPVDPVTVHLAFPAGPAPVRNVNNGGGFNSNNGGFNGSNYNQNNNNGGGGYNSQNNGGGYNNNNNSGGGGGYNNNNAGGGGGGYSSGGYNSGPANPQQQQANQGYGSSAYGEPDAYNNNRNNNANNSYGNNNNSGGNNSYANNGGYGNPIGSPLASPSAMQSQSSPPLPLSPLSSPSNAPFSPSPPQQPQQSPSFQPRPTGPSPFAFKPRGAPLGNPASPPPRALANPAGALGNPAAAPSRVLGNPGAVPPASGPVLGNPAGSPRMGPASQRSPIILGAGGALSNPPLAAAPAPVGVGGPVAGGAGALGAPRARSNLRARLKLTSSLLSPPPIEGDAPGQM